MAKAKRFKLLQPKQIFLYKNNSFGVFSISLKEEDNNIESVINKNNNEKDV